MARRPTGSSPRLDGLLLVDKPAGISSHDVVLMARRALGEPQVGHGGTLDPFATGLLVLLTGRATRLHPYVQGEPKVYEARIRFGAETDTEDPGGAVTREAPPPTRAALVDALPGFRGATLQTPSTFSAKRIGGQRAYDVARAGGVVTLAPAPIVVHELAIGDVEEQDGRVVACTLRVSCGTGTYIRALARDIARVVGSAAHLTALRRLRVGVFDLAHAVSLDALRAGQAIAAPAITALRGHPSQPLTAEEIARVTRGIDVEARVPGASAALLDPDAPSPATALVAFAERRTAERGDRWQPRVVLRDR